MSDESVLARVRKEAERHHENAIHALTQLSFDAQSTLDGLMNNKIATTVGGSVLNQQLFMDAERSLVLWKQAADIAVWMATEVGLEAALGQRMDLLIVAMNMPDEDKWLCSDEQGQLWVYDSPHFYENLTTGHDEVDSQVEPGHNIRVRTNDVRRVDGSEAHDLLN